MTRLDKMYLPNIKAVLNTEDGKEFLAYILRKLKYCDKLENQNDVIIHNSAIELLEDMIEIVGIGVNVLKIY